MQTLKLFCSWAPFLLFFHCCKGRRIPRWTGTNAESSCRPKGVRMDFHGFEVRAARGWEPGGLWWGAEAPAVEPGWSGRCWSWWRGALQPREAWHLQHPMHLWTASVLGCWVFFVFCVSLLPGCSTQPPHLRVTFCVCISSFRLSCACILLSTTSTFWLVRDSLLEGTPPQTDVLSGTD